MVNVSTPWAGTMVHKKYKEKIYKSISPRAGEKVAPALCRDRGQGVWTVTVGLPIFTFYLGHHHTSHITHHTSHHHNYVTCSGKQAAWLPRVTWSQDHILTHIWLKKYILKWDNVL